MPTRASRCPGLPARGRCHPARKTRRPPFSPMTPSCARTAACSSAPRHPSCTPGHHYLLGLGPEEYSYEACSQDAETVSSGKGPDLELRLLEYCAARIRMDVEKELNVAQIGCCPVMNARNLLPAFLLLCHVTNRDAPSNAAVPSPRNESNVRRTMNARAREVFRRAGSSAAWFALQVFSVWTEPAGWGRRPS